VAINSPPETICGFAVSGKFGGDVFCGTSWSTPGNCCHRARSSFSTIHAAACRSEGRLAILSSSSPRRTSSRYLSFSADMLAPSSTSIMLASVQQHLCFTYDNWDRSCQCPRRRNKPRHRHHHRHRPGSDCISRKLQFQREMCHSE
jgi:hypothetical protein